MRLRNFLYLVGFTALPMSVSAQSIEVGDSRVDASFIQPYEATFKFFDQSEEGEPVFAGTWTDDVTLTESEDQEVLSRRVVRFTPDGVADLERTTTATANTLAPITTHQVFGENLSGVMHVDFNETAMTQILISQPSAAARVLQVELGQNVFERSFWATLAMSLPFEEGLTVELPTYALGKNTVGSEVFEVHGIETVEAMGTTFPARRITAPGSNWTFWVRKEPPYIVQITHPSSSGGTATSVLEAFQQQ